MRRISQFDVTPEDAARFTAKCKADESGCILWIGRTRVIKGIEYPMFDLMGARPARSIAWILAGKGDTPRTGINLTCGKSLCVCAEHMEAAHPIPPRRVT